MALSAKAALRHRARGFRWPHRDRSIRAQLVLFALAATLPLVLFAALTAVRSYQSERARLEQHTHEIVRAFTLAVDRELKSKQTALGALATALSLQSGDLDAFRRQAHAFLATQPAENAVVLLDAAGRILVHTELPEGTPLSHWSDVESVRQVFRTGRPWISDLFVGLAGQPRISVDVPVIRDGVVLYDLSMRIPLDSLHDLLAEQRLPEGWITAIIDRTGTIVARSDAPDDFAGQSAGPILHDAIAASNDGAVSMRSPEGEEIIAVFRRSPVTGWRAAIGIPQKSLDAPLERALWTTAGGGALLLGLAALLAVLIADRIARPILSLKRAALALGQGEEPDAPPGGIREVREVGYALQAAATLLRKAGAERDRTEQALRERDERLHAALFASSTGTYRWDVLTDALEEDESLSSLMGVLPGEAPRCMDAFYERLHPDDRGAVMDAARRSAAEGADFAMDYRIVRPDGSLRWLADKGKLVRDAAGRPLYMTGASTDITERKRAEERLRESESRFAGAFAQAAVGLAIKAPDGRFIEVNAAFCVITGYARAQLLETDFAAITHPEDRDANVRHIRSMLAGDDKGRPYEKRYVRKDGTILWVRNSVSVVRDGAGRPVNLVTISEDITERKHAEKRLRESERRERARAAELAAVLEAVPAVVFVAHDPDCQVITGSRATYELLRLPPGSNLSKSAPDSETNHFMVMKNGVTLSPDALPLQRAARGEALRRFEEQVVFADGRSHDLYGHALPLRDEQGLIRGAVGAFLDITDRKRAEEHQRLLMAELSHRVNNTLAVVQAIATQTLKRSPSPELFIPAFQGRLRALAGAHALLTQGRWRAASLAALVRQALAAHGAQEGTNAVVQGEELLLSPKQVVTLGLVLHELATNATKYGALSVPTGRVEVRWAVENPQGAMQLRIAWRETGGPVVGPPRAGGFGSGLIRNGLAYELKGTAVLEFEPEGLRCTIVIPWRGRQPPEPGIAAWAASGDA